MGSEGDNSIFRDCSFGKAFMEDDLDFPEPRMLLGTETLAPFIWVGDDAFPNKPNLLRPYAKNPMIRRTPGGPPQHLTGLELKKTKVFNYRLSWARMVVECAFGILSSHFRFLM